MGVIASSKSQSIPPIPAGTYPAVCVAVVDIGHHPNTYPGKEGEWQDQVYIGFEIPSERIEIEENGAKVSKPRMASMLQTNSIGKKSNLGQMLVTWRGREFTDAEKEAFDLRTILGVSCLLTLVLSKDEQYHNIKGISKPIAGTAPVKPEVNLVKYSMEEDGVNEADVPSDIPEWVVEKFIKTSHEWTKGPFVDTQPDQMAPSAIEENPDDIPF